MQHSRIPARQPSSPLLAGRVRLTAEARVEGGGSASTFTATLVLKRGYKPLNPYAVDFRLSPTDALNAFDKFHKQSWLSPLMTTLKTSSDVRPVFLPFWVFEASVKGTVSGEVGHRVLRPEYNIRTKRMEMRASMQWQPTNRHKMPLIKFHNNQPEMQVLASYAHKQEYAEAIKGQYIDAAKRMTSAMMEGPQGEKREVEPFEMFPSVARERLITDLKSYILHDGSEYLRILYSADDVRSVTIDFDFIGDIKPFPVYLPSYVVEYSYMGHNFRALVNGVNGQVGGEHHYSSFKVGGLTALGAIAGAAALGLDFLNIPSFISIGLASVVAGVAARYYPFYAAWRKEQRRVAEEALQKRQAHFSWESDSFWRDYGEHQRQQRDKEREEELRWQKSRQQQQHQRQQYQRTSYDREPPRTRPQSVDPKGYYRLLELSGKEGTATEEEVKTAFRRLAMKYHPDMQKTEQEKKKNSEIFKRVVTAYQVLRDKTKRSNYDRYGTE